MTATPPNSSVGDLKRKGDAQREIELKQIWHQRYNNEDFIASGTNCSEVY